MPCSLSCHERQCCFLQENGEKRSHGGVFWGIQSSPGGLPSDGVGQLMLVSYIGSERRGAL